MSAFSHPLGESGRKTNETPPKCLNWKGKTPWPNSYDNNNETELKSIQKGVKHNQEPVCNSGWYSFTKQKNINIVVCIMSLVFRSWERAVTTFRNWHRYSRPRLLTYTYRMWAQWAIIYERPTRAQKVRPYMPEFEAILGCHFHSLWVRSTKFIFFFSIFFTFYPQFWVKK